MASSSHKTLILGTIMIVLNPSSMVVTVAMMLVTPATMTDVEVD
jgi:hypothetical protein